MSEIAILGSGPSLEKYRGQHPIAVAVNGAAFCKFSYQYFVCGDLRSPFQKWFYASEEKKAQRLLASYLAPLDKVLYPKPEIRTSLQKELRRYSVLSRESQSLAPLYQYTPKIKPAEGHGWFQYTAQSFEEGLKAWSLSPAPPFLHGATILGVAIQWAFVEGYRELHIYGSSVPDAVTRESYFSQRALKRDRLIQLTQRIEALGARVTFH